MEDASEPVLSNRELILEMRGDLRRVAAFVEVLTAADLPTRVTAIERWQERWGGRVVGLGLIGTSLIGLMLVHVFNTV